jgi:hypothetical protein
MASNGCVEQGVGEVTVSKTFQQKYHTYILRFFTGSAPKSTAGGEAEPGSDEEKPFVCSFSDE